jgi:hypothetical protein
VQIIPSAGKTLPRLFRTLKIEEVYPEDYHDFEESTRI